MCISENTLNVIITSIVSIISLLLGFLLSRYQFKKEKQLQTAQQKFAMFYRPFVEMCRVTYYIDIDPDTPFTSLDDSERFKILSHLRKYDYLATEAIQQQIFALNRFAAHIGENVPCDSDMLEHADSAYTALYGSIISEYERLCKELSSPPPKSL